MEYVPRKMVHYYKSLALSVNFVYSLFLWPYHFKFKLINIAFFPQTCTYPSNVPVFCPNLNRPCSLLLQNRTKSLSSPAFCYKTIQSSPPHPLSHYKTIYIWINKQTNKYISLQWGRLGGKRGGIWMREQWGRPASAVVTWKKSMHLRL